MLLVSEVPDSQSVSRRDVLPNKALFKNDSLLVADTYVIHACVSRQVPSISRGTNSRPDVRAGNLQASRIAAEAGSCKSFADFAQCKSVVRRLPAKNRPARFCAWIIPPWANWSYRHDLWIALEFEFEVVTRPRNRAEREAIELCDLGACIRSLLSCSGVSDQLLTERKFLSHNYEILFVRQDVVRLWSAARASYYLSIKPEDHLVFVALLHSFSMKLGFRLLHPSTNLIGSRVISLLDDASRRERT